MDKLANLLARAILALLFASVLIAAHELASEFDQIVAQPARVAAAPAAPGTAA